MVPQSRRACVGCSCVPSPALTTEARMRSATRWGAPELLWRRTTMRGPIASRFRHVSRSVSPFCDDENDSDTLTTSADNRFAAISNDVRVRVEASMKRFTTVLPPSVFLRVGSPLFASKLASARSRIDTIDFASSPSIPRRCLIPSPSSGRGRLRRRAT